MGNYGKSVVGGTAYPISKDTKQLIKISVSRVDLNTSLLRAYLDGLATILETSGAIEPTWGDDFVADNGILWRKIGGGGYDNGGWQALSEFTTMAITANGAVWVVNDAGGTSGASEPDWASAPNFNDTLIDGDIEWINVGVYTIWAPNTAYLLENDDPPSPHNVYVTSTDNTYLYYVYSFFVDNSSLVEPDWGTGGDPTRDIDNGIAWHHVGGGGYEGSWQALHFYPTYGGGNGVIVADGSVWGRLGSGTSGSSEPNWASKPLASDQLVDGTVTWIRFGVSGTYTGTWQPNTVYPVSTLGGNTYVTSTDNNVLVYVEGIRSESTQLAKPVIYSAAGDLVGEGDEFSVQISHAASWINLTFPSPLPILDNCYLGILGGDQSFFFDLPVIRVYGDANGGLIGDDPYIDGAYNSIAPELDPWVEGSYDGILDAGTEIQVPGIGRFRPYANKFTTGTEEPAWDSEGAYGENGFAWGASTFAPGPVVEWEADTSYIFHEKSIVRDGSVWLCEVAGISGETEPDWSLSSNYGDIASDGTVGWIRQYVAAVWEPETTYQWRTKFTMTGATNISVLTVFVQSGFIWVPFPFGGLYGSTVRDTGLLEPDWDTDVDNWEAGFSLPYTEDGDLIWLYLEPGVAPSGHDLSLYAVSDITVPAPPVLSVE